VKERAIHYTRAMREARRAGLKTQTRRVCRDQTPRAYKLVEDCESYPNGAPYTGWVKDIERLPFYMPTVCPYGAPGDILYVHEPIEFLNIGNGGTRGRLRYLDDGDTAMADIPRCVKVPKLGPWKGRTLPPEWARDRDRVTDVRVERVQEISDDDILAEGTEQWAWQDEEYRGQSCIWRDSAEALRNLRRKWFVKLWDSINAKRGFGWEVNPWVWVVTFEGVKP